MTGVCPQQNVLFDDLTCHEHLTFYANLKGVAKDRVASHVSRSSYEGYNLLLNKQVYDISSFTDCYVISIYFIFKISIKFDISCLVERNMLVTTAIRSFLGRPLLTCPTNDIFSQVANTMHDADLTEVEDTCAKQLSGGQKRKLCVALALIADPKVRHSLHTIR